MVWLNVCVVGLLMMSPVQSSPAPKELKAYVLSIDDTKLVVSNVRVGPAGGGQTFVMTAPKDGAAPNWTAADPNQTGDGQKKMMMMTTTAGDAPLQMTEFALPKGAVKAAEFPRGTEVVVTYRESAGTKTFMKLEIAKQP